MKVRRKSSVKAAMDMNVNNDDIVLQMEESGDDVNAALVKVLLPPTVCVPFCGCMNRPFKPTRTHKCAWMHTTLGFYKITASTTRLPPYTTLPTLTCPSDEVSPSA